MNYAEKLGIFYLKAKASAKLKKKRTSSQGVRTSSITRRKESTIRYSLSQNRTSDDDSAFKNIRHKK